MQFPPNVEQWRPIVQKYFPPELVDKALWTIQYESGGDPSAAGDGGAARGLFQIQDNRNFPSRPDAAFLDNPENNIAYAANQLGAASGNFAAWGENNLYQGKPFGALGNHPFPGSEMTNARASTGAGVKFNPAAARNQDTEGGYRLSLPAGTTWDDPEANKPRPSGTTVSGRNQVSGTAEERANQLIGLTEQAWGTFDDYMVSQEGLFPDLQAGIVQRMVPDEATEEGYRLEVDSEATKLLQSALSYEDQLGRLLTYRDQGLLSFGEDNASSFLNAEKEASSEAERAYNDYRTRVGDVFNIEALEGARADQIGAAADAATDAHIKAKQAAREGIAVTDSGFRFPGQEEGQGYRDAIRATIPGQAPAFRPLSSAAISQAYPGATAGKDPFANMPLSTAASGGTLSSRGNLDNAQSTLDRIGREGINLKPKFDPIRPPEPGQIMPGEKVDLGPAGFSPEDYISRYLLPSIQRLGNPIGGFR